MTFFSRPNLEDIQFKQISGTTLTLSGTTKFASPFGLQLYDGTGGYRPLIATGGTEGDVLTLVNGKILLKPASAVDIYDGESPAAIEVGGIEVGTILTGRTLVDILEEMLVPELFPALTPPSVSVFTMTPSTTTYEAGHTISTLTFNATFSRGSINPQYESDEQFRSGLPNTYTYSGPDIDTTPKSKTDLTDSQSISDYEVSHGSQSWNVRVDYDAGVQPKGSKGTDYLDPLAEGFVVSINRTIIGRLRQFWGAAATVPVDSAGVRALPDNNFETVNVFDLTTGIVHTNFVVAIPATKNIISVIDLTNLNLDVTSEYVLIDGSFTVNDIGGNPRTYKLYAMTTAIPYSPSATHRITVS